MAIGLGAGVPWVMCKQTDAPENIVSVFSTFCSSIFVSKFLLYFFSLSMFILEWKPWCLDHAFFYSFYPSLVSIPEPAHLWDYHSFFHPLFLKFWQIDACNGFYCDGFKPNNYRKPVLWTEDWNGWYADACYIFLTICLWENFKLLTIWGQTC